MNNVNDLVKKIMDDVKSQNESIFNGLLEVVEKDIKGDLISYIKIPDSPRITKDSPIQSSQIIDGMAPRITKLEDGTFGIEFWHVPTLETNSTPGSDSIPIWSMLNWGSGPKVSTTSKVRGQDSTVSTKEYLQYTRPISTRRESPYTVSKPPYERESGFLWRPKKGRGRRKEGYYIPEATVNRVNAARVERGKTAKLTTEKMQYYTPQYYIERSISMLLGKMRSLLNKSNSGLIPKNPVN